jgi:transposase
MPSSIEPPRISRRFQMLRGWGHGRKSKFSPEARERAVRLVLEPQAQHESEWAAIASVASKIACGPETLRKWLRRTQVDSGKRAGTTSADGAQKVWQQLRREVLMWLVARSNA